MPRKVPGVLSLSVFSFCSSAADFKHNGGIALAGEILYSHFRLHLSSGGKFWQYYMSFAYS